MAKPNPLQIGVALQKGKCVAGYQWTRQSAAARASWIMDLPIEHLLLYNNHGVEHYPSTFSRHCNVTVNPTSASLCVLLDMVMPTHEAVM